MPGNAPQASTRCVGPRDLPGQDGDGICGRAAKAKGLCPSHARRMERNGTLARRRAPFGKPKRPTWKAAGGTCNHPDGCTLPEFAAGWCSMHYGRVYKTGDPGPVHALREVEYGDTPTCKHPDGCPLPAWHGDGWCVRHGMRVAQTGDPGPLHRLKRRGTAHESALLRESYGQVWIEGDTSPQLHPAYARDLEDALERQGAQ